MPCKIISWPPVVCTCISWPPVVCTVNEGFMKTLVYVILRPTSTVVMLEGPTIPTKCVVGLSLLFAIACLPDLPSRHIISYWAPKEHIVVHFNGCCCPTWEFVQTCHESSVFQNSRVLFKRIGNLIIFYWLGPTTNTLSGFCFCCWISQSILINSAIWSTCRFLCYKVQILKPNLDLMKLKIVDLGNSKLCI